MKKRNDIHSEIATRPYEVVRDEDQPMPLARHLALGLPVGIGGMVGGAAAHWLDARLAVLGMAIVVAVTGFVAVAKWMDEEMALAAQPAYAIAGTAAALPVFGFMWMPEWVMFGSMVAMSAAFGAWAGSVTITSSSFAPEPGPALRIGAIGIIVGITVMTFAVAAVGDATIFAGMSVLALFPLGLHVMLQNVADGRTEEVRTISHVAQRLGVQTATKKRG